MASKAHGQPRPWPAQFMTRCLAGHGLAIGWAGTVLD